MDRAGLIAELVKSAQKIEEGRKWLDSDGLEHAGRVSYKSGLAIALDTFKEAQAYAEKDLELSVLAEYTFIMQDLNFCAPSDRRTITSLKKGVLEFDEAFLALGVLQNTDAYKTAEQLFPSRADFRYGGMPKDCFHIACSADIARLGNNLSTPGVNPAEKALWGQRIANIKNAQAVYWAKQKAALGAA